MLAESCSDVNWVSLISLKIKKGEYRVVFFKIFIFSFFRHCRHIGILGPDDKDEFSIEMLNRMDPQDFQNTVDKCCSLLAFTKWGVVFTMCYNNEIKENLISVSTQHCGECGYTEKHHSASVCHV